MIICLLTLVTISLFLDAKCLKINPKPKGITITRMAYPKKDEFFGHAQYVECGNNSILCYDYAMVERRTFLLRYKKLVLNVIFGTSNLLNVSIVRV